LQYHKAAHQKTTKGGIHLPKLGWPHPDHENHLCYYQNMGMVEADLDHYKELVKDGKFVCANCGRVAKEAKNLCNPVAL
jgi:hypothetical protein